LLPGFFTRKWLTL